MPLFSALPAPVPCRLPLAGLPPEPRQHDRGLMLRVGGEQRVDAAASRSSTFREMGHRPLAYPASCLLPGGEFQEDAQVFRRVLVEELGLKARDIAALFSKEARRGFDFSVRRGGIVVSLGKDGPAVIVAGQAAWILQRGSPIRHVGERVRDKFLEVVNLDISSLTTSGDVGPYARLQRSGVSDNVAEGPTTFALSVTEAAILICLERLTSALQKASLETLSVMRGFAKPGLAGFTANQLEALRRSKQRLDYIKSQTNALQQALLEALDDEVDLLQLARAVGPTSEDWELCFEYYSQSAEELVLEASRQIEDLEDLERSISLRLSSRRVELETLQLYLALLGIGLSTGALLTGIFGMNLMNGLETQRLAFWQVCTGIGLVCAVVSGGLRLIVSKRLSRQGATTLMTNFGFQPTKLLAPPKRPSRLVRVPLAGSQA